MTDKELLVLAAKASGIKRIEYRDEVPYVSMGYLPLDDWEAWNPLVNDCDALRLAVKLRMEIYITLYEIEIHVYIVTVFQPTDGDVLAATRRAIVRAAAEIGKAMP